MGQENIISNIKTISEIFATTAAYYFCPAMLFGFYNPNSVGSVSFEQNPVTCITCSVLTYALITCYYFIRYFFHNYKLTNEHLTRLSGCGDSMSRQIIFKGIKAELYLKSFDERMNLPRSLARDLKKLF